MAADPRIFLSTQPILPLGNHTVKKPQGLETANVPSFADALRQAQGKVMFSKHAQQRLESRQIRLTQDDLTKLDNTVEKMAQKGARESLIYMNDMALIVSVANRTVITAMDGSSAKENIFTNIDSAAII